MSKLILHMGLHKTGTTTIQDAIGCNSEILKKNGILYPQYEGLFYQHGLTSIWLTLPEKYTFKKDPLFYWDDIIKQRDEYDITFISSEEFSRQYPLGVNYHELYNIIDKYSSIEVVIVVRHQIQYIQSIYNEINKTGNVPKFWEFLKKSISSNIIDGMHLDYSVLFEKIEASMPKAKLTVLSYDALRLSSMGYVSDFLSYLSIDEKIMKYERNLRSNVSQDHLANWILSNLNIEKNIKNYNSVINVLQEKFEEGFRSTILTYDELCFLEDYFAEMNSKISFNQIGDMKLNSFIKKDYVFRNQITDSLLLDIKNFLK